ncbi:hypothetical protein JRO89_XS09G0079400 [Xanthoceras sorbifolium]|uniref:Uncharacterized protein n=1 Tax=Xanthoceras sorbifolium TaxID=99658 RepID=A0ABQ8HKS3_9ROSI|nr:hypothetical protein JRO89_XS09G0079400 [Xanthoceras sorbifolium]
MELHKIPAGIFAKLCRLQNLVVHWGLEIQRVAVEEATRLKNLDSVKAQFHNLQDFNCYVKSLSSHGGPNEYGLFLYPKDMEMHPSDWRLISFNINKEDTMPIIALAFRRSNSSRCSLTTARTTSPMDTMPIIALTKTISNLSVGQICMIYKEAYQSSSDLSSPPPALEKIDVSEEWWEALE